MTLTGKARAALRAQAHHLDPIAQIGQHGITAAVVASIDDALTARKLVKIQVSKAGDLRAKQAAPILAERLGAEVIQVIGRTLTLYRPPADEDSAPFEGHGPGSILTD